MYVTLLLEYLPNEDDATYPSVCKTTLRLKIGYDLKKICTTLEVNMTPSDQTRSVNHEVSHFYFWQ